MEMIEQLKRYHALYNALWRETNAIYEEWAKQRGWSYCELLVILSLVENQDTCKQKDICQLWQLPKQTVNTILKKFLVHRWVELAPCKEDHRNKVIHLTITGKETFEEVASALQHCEEIVWERLGKDRADTLIENTKRYNQFFREAGIDENT